MLVTLKCDSQVECPLETGAPWFHPQPAAVLRRTPVQWEPHKAACTITFSFFFFFLVYPDLKSYLKQVIQQPSGLLNSFFHQTALIPFLVWKANAKS